MSLPVRVLLALPLVAACLVARPSRAQGTEEPPPAATVQCDVSPCVVEISAKLDAATAVQQLQEAITASIEDPSSVGVTTDGMVKVFGGMFGLVFFFWGLGYGVGAAIQLIRRL